MSRLLFIAAIIAIVYLLTKSFRGGGTMKKGRMDAENMVRCSYCGVHLPESEALMVGGNYYCNEAHRDACQTRDNRPNAE